jgi:hypothetical protein
MSFAIVLITPQKKWEENLLCCPQPDSADLVMELIELRTHLPTANASSRDSAKARSYLHGLFID